MRKPLLKAAALTAAAVLSCQAWTGAQNQNPADNARNAADQAGQAARGAADRAGQNVRAAAGQPGSIVSDLQKPGNMSPKEVDQHFIMEAAQGNMFEIAAGKVAEQKATNPQLKQFAQMLIQDHTAANDQLKPIAQQAGVQWPAQLNEAHQAMVSHLEKRSGSDFDRHFLYGQVATHVKDRLIYRDAIAMTQNPQLKQWAQQTDQTVLKHLQHGEALADANEAVTAGEHIRGSGNTPQPNESK
ncbi:MAG: outer membrane protein [Phycisphaerales bacterium]|nr:outer membrane protein [Phycisphaerales bacterium]